MDEALFDELKKDVKAMFQRQCVVKGKKGKRCSCAAVSASRFCKKHASLENHPRYMILPHQTRTYLYHDHPPNEPCSDTCPRKAHAQGDVAESSV